MNERMRQAAKAGAARYDAIRAMMKAPVGELPKSVGELADRMANLDGPAPPEPTKALLYAMMPETLLVISGTFEQFKLYSERFPTALRPRLKFVQGWSSVVGRSATRTCYVTIGTWGEVDSKREARRQVEERNIPRWGATAWT